MKGGSIALFTVKKNQCDILCVYSMHDYANLNMLLLGSL
jgi:hypothetical protein